MQPSNSNPDNLSQHNNQAAEDFKKKNEHFLGLCYSVFHLNIEGRELLKILQESLIEQIPVADPEKSDNHAFYREGHMGLVR